MQEYSGTIRFILDGRVMEVNFAEAPGVGPATTLLDFIRSIPGHTGTKEGCGMGDCGACTVVLADVTDGEVLNYRTVNACLILLPMVHGKQVITIENLAQRISGELRLHPVQELLVGHHAIQCGYCTPGVTMSMFGIFKNRATANPEEIGLALSGNLCRCTGYEKIREAAMKIGGMADDDHFVASRPEVVTRLKAIAEDTSTLVIRNGKGFYLKPFLLREALDLKNQHPGAILLSGATDLTLKHTDREKRDLTYLDLGAVKELQTISTGEDHFRIGAAVTIEQLRLFSKVNLPPLFRILNRFGSQQIRNVATLAGNIGSASPIGDALPLLIAYGASVTVASSVAVRSVSLEDFITGYHQTQIGQDEIITGILIPKPEPGHVFQSYKISRRNQVDISTVSAGFRLFITGGVVTSVILAYGGMDKIPRRACHAEAALTGKNWTRETVELAMKALSNDFSPYSDVRAGAAYRMSIARNLLLKFFLEYSPDKTDHLISDQDHG